MKSRHIWEGSQRMIHRALERLVLELGRGVVEVDPLGDYPLEVFATHDLTADDEARIVSSAEFFFVSPFWKNLRAQLTAGS